MLDQDTVDRVSDLLNIVEKVAKSAPQFMNISGEAMAELREIDAAIRKEKVGDLPPPPAPAGDANPLSPNSVQSKPPDGPLFNQRLGSTPSQTGGDDE
jgi:hypothetical protein